MNRFFERLSIILLAFISGLATGYFLIRSGSGSERLISSIHKSSSPEGLLSQSPPETSWSPLIGDLKTPEGIPATNLIEAFKLRSSDFGGLLAKASASEILQAIESVRASSYSRTERNNILAILVGRLGEIDGNTAVGIGLQEFDLHGNSIILNEAFRGWAEKSPVEALKSLDSLKLNASVQEDIQKVILAEWASQAPESAASFALMHRDNSNPQGLVAVVADEWSKENPATAAAWASKLGPGVDKMWAINNIIGNWGTANLEEVANYVTSHPTGESKDLMAASLAQKIAKADLSAGLKWIEIINNPDIQRAASLGFLMEAYNKNPANATACLKNSNLPVNLKNELMDLLDLSTP